MKPDDYRDFKEKYARLIADMGEDDAMKEYVGELPMDGVPPVTLLRVIREWTNQYEEDLIKEHDPRRPIEGFGTTGPIHQALVDWAHRALWEDAKEHYQTHMMGEECSPQ